MSAPSCAPGAGACASQAPGPWQPWAVAGLLFNAMVWGLSWWPMRTLQAAGLHPLWSTALIFTLTSLPISLARPQAWRALFTQAPLWLIVLAAGITNAAFNWGVTMGDVVRVVLLFYVMPLWAVLLAWAVLGERPTRSALWRVALAVGGAGLVLWPTSGQPVAAWQWVDGLGLLGGLSFACNNVLLRRLAGRDSAARGLAMFVGGAVVSAGLALAWHVPLPPLAQAGHWLPWAAGLGLCFLASNLALQYSATRLPANVTAVVMITEVLWASGSALWLGAGTLHLALGLGGALILSAALLAAWRP